MDATRGGPSWVCKVCDDRGAAKGALAFQDQHGVQAGLLGRESAPIQQDPMTLRTALVSYFGSRLTRWPTKYTWLGGNCVVAPYLQPFPIFSPSPTTGPRTTSRPPAKGAFYSNTIPPTRSRRLAFTCPNSSCLTVVAAPGEQKKFAGRFRFFGIARSYALKGAPSHHLTVRGRYRYLSRLSLHVIQPIFTGISSHRLAQSLLAELVVPCGPRVLWRASNVAGTTLRL